MKDPIDNPSVQVILSNDMKQQESGTKLDSKLELGACDSLGDLSPSNGASNNGNSDCLTVSSVTESFRSSNSSLAKSENSDSHVSALKNPSRASSAQLKKVSIADAPSLVIRREHAVSPNGGDKLNSHRASLIQVSNCRKARKVRFFINGDKFFKGAVIAVNNEKFRTFDKLLEHLTRIMCTQVTLPNGVRSIYNLEGKLMCVVDEIQVRQLSFKRYIC